MDDGSITGIKRVNVVYSIKQVEHSSRDHSMISNRHERQK